MVDLFVPSELIVNSRGERKSTEDKPTLCTFWSFDIETGIVFCEH